MSLLVNKKIVGLLFGSLTFAYPFLIYYFVGVFPPTYFIIGIISLLAFRAILPFFSKRIILNSSEKFLISLAIVIGVVMSGLSLWESDIAPLLYPVVMSLTIATIFSVTLLYPPSMIERFARLVEPKLDISGISYTRKVTFVWVIFCLVNAFISLGTVILGDITLWTLYNGCISYILIGLLMVGEYITRRYYKSKSIQ